MEADVEQAGHHVLHNAVENMSCFSVICPVTNMLFPRTVKVETPDEVLMNKTTPRLGILIPVLSQDPSAEMPSATCAPYASRTNSINREGWFLDFAFSRNVP